MARELTLEEHAGSWYWRFTAPDGVVVRSAVAYVSEDAARAAGEKAAQPKVVERSVEATLNVSLGS